MGSSSSSRTTLSGLVVAHTPRTVSRSISCSELNLRSNMVSSPLRGLRAGAPAGGGARVPPVTLSRPGVVVLVHRQRHPGHTGGLGVVVDRDGDVDGHPAAI